MSNKEKREMTQTSVKVKLDELEDDFLPREVLQSNLEQRTTAAALEAAASLNKKFNKNVVEVTRKNVTLANDGGVDIEVSYSERVWDNPGDFQKSFFPKLKGNIKD